jgi:hypothetical protein
VAQLAAADADVLKSHGTQAHGIQKILGVDDDWLLEQMLDAIKVEGSNITNREHEEVLRHTPSIRAPDAELLQKEMDYGLISNTAP